MRIFRTLHGVVKAYTSLHLPMRDGDATSDTQLIPYFLSLTNTCTGPVKKCGLLKVLHEKFKPPTSRQQPSNETLAFKQSLEEVAEQNKELLPHIGKAQVRKCRKLRREGSEE